MVSADPIQAPIPSAETPENPFDSAAIRPPLPPSPHPLISPSPPPLSPRDQTLLQSLLTLRLDFTAFALKENLPADQLIDWAESAPIAPRLQSLRRLANLSLDIRHTQARRAAVDILESIASTAEDPIEKRRAATALLRRPEAPPRSAGPRSPSPGYPHAPRGEHHPDSGRRTPGLKTSSHPSSHHHFITSSSPPGPLYFPSMVQPPPAPDESAADIADRASAALAYSEAPQSLANVFALLAPSAEVCGKPAPPSIAEFIVSHANTPAAAIPHIRHTYETHLRHERSDPTGEIYRLEVLSNSKQRHTLRLTISQRLGRWLVTKIEPANSS